MAGWDGIEIFFLVCAVLGGAFVLLRLVLMFVGLGDDFDADGPDGGGDFHHEDSDAGFRVLSLHSLTSFLLMFGLVALSLYRQSHLGVLIAVLGGGAAGCASVWLIGKLFAMFNRLQSSGTIDVGDAIGAVGSVYLTIPAKGTGRVLVKVHNSLREYDASSSNETEIPTDTPVRVVWVDGGILVVEEI